MNTTCPLPDSLRRYAIGDIDDLLGQEIEQHLAECSACEDTVAQFDSADDTLMRHLPLAAPVGAEAGANGGDPPGWLERLRGGPSVERTFSPFDANGNAVPLTPGPSPRHGESATDGRGEHFEESGEGQFSAYELLGVLGRGGMGVVYRARHRHLNRQVALKVLSPRLTQAAEARRRFEREIQVLGGLHHPGIVMATDAGRIDEAAYLVMELIDGVDLARLVRQSGPLSVAEACEAARQMAEALSAAHRAGTVHRDVKPSNVMVDGRGRVKLLDFGLAHLNALTSESLETSLGRLLGTLDYMAPEQAGDQDQLDARADLYSLGATLYYLLTGQPPHGSHVGRSLVQQLRALAAGDAPRVSTLRADVPAGLDEFIAKLLSREPEGRPASAEAVAAELSQWAGGDLAKRMQECTPHAPQCSPLAPREGSSAFDESHSVVAAQESLCELLGKQHIADPSWVSGSRTDPSDASHPTKSKTRGGEMVGLSGGGRITRSVMGTLVATATFGFFAWGAVILLRTPEGTLRIESEVDNIAVELVDEQQATKKLEIDQGAKETTLRAGRYQVRIAGTHEGVTIDKDEITLRRGEQVVARIVRTVDEVTTSPQTVTIETAADTTTRPPTVPAPGERLYRGIPVGEWPNVFAAETDPAAKLDAAAAVLTLLPEPLGETEVKTILDLGEVLVREMYGEDALLFAFVQGGGWPTTATHWDFQIDENSGFGSNRRGGGTQSRRGAGRVSSPTLQSSYREYRTQLSARLDTIAPELLARMLCRAVEEGSEARAAFALQLLRWPLGYPKPTVAENAVALEYIASHLKLPSPGVNRAGIGALVRASYAWNLPVRQEVLPQLAEVAKAVLNYPPGALHDAMRTDLLRFGASTNSWSEEDFRRDWPAEYQRLFARLVLDELIGEAQPIQPRFYVDLTSDDLNDQLSRGGGFGGRGGRAGEPDQRRAVYPSYEPEQIASIRAATRYFLNEFLPVANEYLAVHRMPPYDEAMGRVLAEVYNTFVVRTDAGSWPVDETVALLSGQLRNYFGDGSDAADVKWQDLLPRSPATMIQIIARGDGKIADFVRDSLPRSRSVIDRIKKLEAGVMGETDPTDFLQQINANEFVGLYEEAPFQVIKLAIGAMDITLPRPPREIMARLQNSATVRRGDRAPNLVAREPLNVSPIDIVHFATRDGGSGNTLQEDFSDGGRLSPTFTSSFVDPQLLLSSVATLAGESEEKDVRIGQLLRSLPITNARSYAPGYLIRTQLKSLIAGPAKSGPDAKRMLREMAAKAKSQALVDAIREIDPTIEARKVEEGD